MSKKFPELKFELYYEECGNAFCGDFACEKGKITLDDQREMKFEGECE